MFIRKYLGVLPSNPMNHRHRDGWPLGITRNARYQVNSFSIAMNLVKSGLAAAYIPHFVVKMENAFLPDEAQIIEVKSFEQARTERPVFLVKQTNNPETKEMKRAAKIFRRSCCIDRMKYFEGQAIIYGEGQSSR